MPALFTPTATPPDAQRLGCEAGYPLGDARTYFYKESVRVGSFSRTGEIDFSPGRWARLPPAASAQVMPLPAAAQAQAFAQEFRYAMPGAGTGAGTGLAASLSLADYLSRQRVMALMVLQGGQRWLEAYQYGRGPQHAFLGHSLAKSITSLAFGLALHEGRLPSLDVRADALVRDLQGALHGQATLRQLLHMASGVRFEDRYDGLGDTASFSKLAATQGIAAAAHALKTREAADGERFAYASAQSSILSLAFQSAVGQDLASYLAPRLWQRLGASHEALWLQDRFGVVRASGSFCATLADYARLGVLLANDGVRPDTGESVLPRDYLLQATDWTHHANAFQPGQATPHMGYGLHFWTLPGRPRRFAMVGVYGQFVFVAPDLQLVMVQLSAGANAKNADTALAHEAHALWQGLTDFFSQPRG